MSFFLIVHWYSDIVDIIDNFFTSLHRNKYSFLFSKPIADIEFNDN